MHHFSIVLLSRSCNLRFVSIVMTQMVFRTWVSLWSQKTAHVSMRKIKYMIKKKSHICLIPFTDLSLKLHKQQASINLFASLNVAPFWDSSQLFSFLFMFRFPIYSVMSIPAHLFLVSRASTWRAGDQKLRRSVFKMSWIDKEEKWRVWKKARWQGWKTEEVGFHSVLLLVMQECEFQTRTHR